MQHDYVVCLECGFRGRAIRRRAGTRHGLEPEQYRDAGSCQPITRSLRRPIRIGGRPRQAVVSTPGFGSARTPAKQLAANRDGTQEVLPEMLTPTQQRAFDHFAKSLSTLADDALIDTYHQAWEDHRDARAEGSDNLGKAGAESLAAKTAMQERFADYQSRYKGRYP